MVWSLDRQVSLACSPERVGEADDGVRGQRDAVRDWLYAVLARLNQARGASMFSSSQRSSASWVISKTPASCTSSSSMSGSRASRETRLTISSRTLENWVAERSVPARSRNSIQSRLPSSQALSRDLLGEVSLEEPCLRVIVGLSVVSSLDALERREQLAVLALQLNGLQSEALDE